jgi:HK97 family phage prohead protease
MDTKPQSLALETKFTTFEVKRLAVEAGLLGHFTAIGNAFDVVDSQGDVTRRGCFKASIAARPTVPLLWSHDPSSPVGLCRNMKETARGLEFEGTLILAVPQAASAWSLLKGVDGLPGLKFSIGYNVVLSTIERDGTRLLKQVALHEISLVSMAANEQSVLLTLDDGKSMASALASMRRTIADIKRTVTR